MRESVVSVWCKRIFCPNTPQRVDLLFLSGEKNISPQHTLKRESAVSVWQKKEYMVTSEASLASKSNDPVSSW